MSISKKLKIAIIGATGYTGLDLIYLLSKHPRIKIINLCATKNLGKKISFFDNKIKKNLPKISSVNNIKWDKLDLVFLSLPNGEAQKIVKKTFNKYKRLKYIDLSADFRISSKKTYFDNYKIKHKAFDLMKYSIYSVTEFNKKLLKKYRIIANPGCYPTSVQIPLIPLIKNNLISSKDIIIDSKSGYSGAGKNLEKKFKHKNIYHSTFAYNTKNHRHICEIDQELLKLTKKRVNYTFTPHVIPTFRGILSSIYVNKKKKITANIIRNKLMNYYKNDKFVKILKINKSLGSGNVLNTNNCEISVCETKNKNRILILSAIDNLVKGASGQAVQNMNLIYNYPETLGLK
jgi:N-acetyl-gamma-glutamyl-phosphate reductase